MKTKALPSYYVGYSTTVKAIIAVRTDAERQVIKDLRDLFGEAISEERGIAFNIFAAIQFVKREGNNFHRAFFANHNGKSELLTVEDKAHEHTYAMLHAICGKIIDDFMGRGQTYWLRTMGWRLSEHSDVAAMWEAITGPKAIVVVEKMPERLAVMG